MSIETVAQEIAALDHRARCKKRAGIDVCIHRSADAWTDLLYRERGVRVANRPTKLRSESHKIHVSFGFIYVSVGFDPEVEKPIPFEVIVTVGKGDPDMKANAEEVGRLVSLCLRSGVHITAIIEQLRGIRGANPVWWQGTQIQGMGDAVAFVLKQYKE